MGTNSQALSRRQIGWGVLAAIGTSFFWATVIVAVMDPYAEPTLPARQWDLGTWVSWVLVLAFCAALASIGWHGFKKQPNHNPEDEVVDENIVRLRSFSWLQLLLIGILLVAFIVFIVFGFGLPPYPMEP